MITKQQIIDYFGSASAAARKLSITRQALSQWRNDRVPIAHQLRMKFEIAPEKFGDVEIPPPSRGGKK